MYSPAANNVTFSGVRAMFDLAAGRENLVNLCLGEPGFITAPNVIEAAVKYLREGKTKYTPNLGMPQLREALSRKLWKENGIRSDPEKNLLVTVGATQALILTMMLFAGPGDEVIIPDPCWPNYFDETYMVNATPVSAPLTEENGFCMTAEIIEPLITEKTKLIVINSPANPTGAVLSRAQIEGIADLVRKYKIPVLSDEPYEKIIFDGAEHVSLASYEDISDYVVTINSFSKTYAMTGWRVGYICAKEEYIRNMVKMHEPMCSCVNEAFQLACIEALENSGDYLDMMLDVYTENRKILVDGLNTIPGFSCAYPKGSFYAFCNIKGTGLSSKEVAIGLLDRAGVVSSPGDAFGGWGDGYIRFSFAASKESIAEAVERMRKADIAGK